MKKTLIAALLALFAVPAFAFDEQVLVTWTDPGTEDSFDIQRQDSACGGTAPWNLIVTGHPANDLDYVDTVTDDASYCYRVRAVKDGQNGPWSAEFGIAVPASLAPITGSASLV